MPFVGPSAQPVAEGDVPGVDLPSEQRAGRHGARTRTGQSNGRVSSATSRPGARTPRRTPRRRCRSCGKCPELAQAEDCDGLRQRARAGDRQGRAQRHQTNPNDAFLPSNTQTPATLLSTDTANGELEELPSPPAATRRRRARTRPARPASRRSRPSTSTTNKVSTKVCICRRFPRASTDLGLATTIRRGSGAPGEPGQSEASSPRTCACAALGSNCGAFGRVHAAGVRRRPSAHARVPDPGRSAGPRRQDHEGLAQLRPRLRIPT